MFSIKNIAQSTVLGVVLLSLASCTGRFLEYNQDPYGATEDNLATVAEGGPLLADMQIYVVPNQENAWQMTFDLVGVLSGLSTTQGFSDDYHMYKPRRGWNDYPYDDTFTHLYQDFNPIATKSKEDFSNFAFAWASILRVATMHRISDIYGPIAFSQVKAGKKGIPYDTQQQLYLSYLEILKKSVESISKMPPNEYLRYAKYDKVYNGDFAKWLLYARSLALRLAIRISGVEPEKAREYAEWAVKEGIIEVNEHNALMPTIDNPAYKTSYNWGDMQSGADIVEYMKAFDDPRIQKYFTEASGRWGYFGARSLPKSSKANIDDFSKPNITASTPIVWMSAAEVAFLKAEGALLGWNMGKSAKELYEEGIKRSFEQWGVDLASLNEYLQNESTRGAFRDPLHPEINDLNFQSSITVKWNDEDPKENLSKIITQKWISFYPYQTIEAWTEWRRTGYPNLMSALVNGSGGEVANITQEDGRDVGGMRRLIFSQKDVENNANSVNEAIKDLGGADSYSTDLWWVKR